MAVIRTCWADGLKHVGSICQMNTGSILGGRPCLGSWSLYGLGSECENLPGYVVLIDYPEEPPGGSRNWCTGFMPATYQGTQFRDGKTPILHVAPAEGHDGAAPAGARSTSSSSSIASICLAATDDTDLEARIAAYELAYRMQTAAPEAVDLSSETAETQRSLRSRPRANGAQRPQLPAGPAAGRARRAIRAALHGLRQQVGCAHATSKETTANTAAKPTGRSPACSRT